MRTPTINGEASDGRLLRVAGAAALLSGVGGLAMVGTLVAMYVGFALGPDARATALKVGFINDALAIAVYGLMLPVVPTLVVLLRETGTTRSLLLAAVGATGIVFTIVLQWMLVTGVLTFQEQIVPVSIALLGVGVWMVGTGILARRTGLLPHGLRDGLLGASYLGYPVWAFGLARGLLQRRAPADG
jgi:hypothetical protein